MNVPRTTHRTRVSGLALLVAVALLAAGASAELSVEILEPEADADLAALNIPLASVPITVRYSSSSGVDTIELWVDGAKQCEDPVSPPELQGERSYNWNAEAHGLGNHTLKIVVKSYGESAEKEVALRIGAGEAPTPERPAIRFVSPAANQVLSDLAHVEVEVTGAQTQWVMFMMDGAHLGACFDAPFRLSIDTTLYARGVHTLQASAKTSAGTIDTEVLMVTFAERGGRTVPPPGPQPRVPAGAALMVPRATAGTAAGPLTAPDETLGPRTVPTESLLPRVAEPAGELEPTAEAPGSGWDPISAGGADEMAPPVIIRTPAGPTTPAAPSDAPPTEPSPRGEPELAGPTIREEPGPEPPTEGAGEATPEPVRPEAPPAEIPDPELAGPTVLGTIARTAERIPQPPAEPEAVTPTEPAAEPVEDPPVEPPADPTPNAPDDLAGPSLGVADRSPDSREAAPAEPEAPAATTGADETAPVEPGVPEQANDEPLGETDAGAEEAAEAHEAEPPELSIEYRGEPAAFEFPAEILGEKTLGLALRDVAKLAGIELKWDDQTKVATGLIGAETVCSLTAGSRLATVRGVRMEFLPPPSIVHDTLYVPVRLAAKLLGVSVTYDPAAQTLSFAPVASE